MSAAAELHRRAEETNTRLTATLAHVIAQLTGGGGTSNSLAGPTGELEGLVEDLHSLHEAHLHHLHQEHTQFRLDSEQREAATAKLLRGLEEENERVLERNQGLVAELGDLQTRYRTASASLKEKEREVDGLLEQLRAQQEQGMEESAGSEGRVREAEERVERWRWKVKEEERERSERERELEASQDMERSLRTTLLECQEQLENTHKELGRTQEELHLAEASLATTNEELSSLKHQLQPKEEELQALQERIVDRAQQLMELLDRRSEDYSREVQEEIVAQSKAYDDLLKRISESSPGSMLTPDTPLSPGNPLDMALRLRDFLNPHLLPPPTVTPSQAVSVVDGVVGTAAFQRYLNTFVDFTQRVRVGEFRSCPKSRLRQHRLQQWRHQFMELSLRPAPGFRVDECPLCDVILLMKGVAKRLGLAPSSLLLYSVEKTRIRGNVVRLWVLRQALSPTLKFEADSLLTDLSLSRHHVTFVSLSDPSGSPSPMEQWEAAHHRLVGRLEESPMTDVVSGGSKGGDGGGVTGRRERSDSMDMVELEPSQPTSQLLVASDKETEDHSSTGRGSRRVGVARRAGFHVKALMKLMCTSCMTSSHGNHNTSYQHLDEVHSNSVT